MDWTWLKNYQTMTDCDSTLNIQKNSNITWTKSYVCSGVGKWEVTSTITITISSSESAWIPQSVPYYERLDEDWMKIGWTIAEKYCDGRDNLFEVIYEDYCMQVWIWLMVIYLTWRTIPLCWRVHLLATKDGSPHFEVWLSFESNFDGCWRWLELLHKWNGGSVASNLMGSCIVSRTIPQGFFVLIHWKSLSHLWRKKSVEDH